MHSVPRTAHLRIPPFGGRAHDRRASVLAGLLLALACALALAFAGSAKAAMFEWEGVAADGLNPGSIATDSAGRVYVPQRGAGVVYVYDSARNGNRPLGSIGSGRLQDPSAVAVDNRLTIYVADAARDVIVTFGSFITGAEYRGTDGANGTALGQMRGVSVLATDPEPRLYVGEQGNLRVQAFDPARGALGSLFAFGVADPAPYGPPAGLTLDAANRFYVSSSAPGTDVRMYDSRGVILGSVIGAGPAVGQVDRPRGLDADPASRLLVADSGNNRVALFDSQAGGFAPLGVFGSPGAGVGQFNDPSSIARAPGALVYVADAANGRIVRLRYDDEDHDGAIDALDNCRGLPNVDQLNHDGDAAGNACDDDDDGDGLADGSDPCPTTNPLIDSNRDGCADPVVSRVAPKSRASFKSGRGPARVSGRAKADTVGVARVLVAVGRRGAGGCSWWSAKRDRFVAGSCERPRWVRARGTKRWHLAVDRRSFTRGSYTIRARAVQRVTGAVEPYVAPRSRFFAR